MLLLISVLSYPKLSSSAARAASPAPILAAAGLIRFPASLLLEEAPQQLITANLRSERMTKPVVTATTLVTDDGVPIDAIHLPGTTDLAIVVAHGFTLSWQRPNVWRIANRLNPIAGVFSFDFRGHGRSGGLSTLGDREIRDLDVVVR